MAYNAYPLLATQPEVRLHVIRLLGTGASVPTKEYGDGVTVTRGGAGVYTLTWADTPGIFLGMFPGLAAVAPGDIDRFSVVREEYVPATRAIQFTVYSEAGAATDLAAAQRLDLILLFKQTGV